MECARSSDAARIHACLVSNLQQTVDNCDKILSTVTSNPFTAHATLSLTHSYPHNTHLQSIDANSPLQSQLLHTYQSTLQTSDTLTDTLYTTFKNAYRIHPHNLALSSFATLIHNSLQSCSSFSLLPRIKHILSTLPPLSRNVHLLLIKLFNNK